jgi:hypothetical protein
MRYSAATVAMPQPEQTQLQQLLRKYTTAVAGPEWDKQDTGGTSDSARAAITEMYRVLGSQPPNVASSPIHGAFLSQLTVLASDRDTRILDTKPRIPALLWAGLIFTAKPGICSGHEIATGAVSIGNAK